MPPRHIDFNPLNWGAADLVDQAPQSTTPDQATTGLTPVEQSLNAFTTAANAGDQPRDTQHQLDWENRQVKYDDAQNKFAANEQNAEQQMQGVEQQSSNQMAQMIPQLISGVASSLGGLIGGMVSPLAQIPQQLLQAGTQALQQGISSAQNTGIEPLTDEQLLGDDALTDPLAEDIGSSGPGGGPDSGTGVPGTEPTATLGAPVTGSTFPSSAAPLKGAVAATSTSTPQSSYMGGMGGMPMIPPGAMGGANQQQDQKPDTKRITTPAVKNGAPVQGRLSVPPPPPVTKLVEGKPVATRRIVTPDTEPAKAEDTKSS